MMASGKVKIYTFIGGKDHQKKFEAYVEKKYGVVYEEWASYEDMNDILLWQSEFATTILRRKKLKRI